MTRIFHHPTDVAAAHIEERTVTGAWLKGLMTRPCGKCKRSGLPIHIADNGNITVGDHCIDCKRPPENFMLHLGWTHAGVLDLKPPWEFRLF